MDLGKHLAGRLLLLLLPTWVCPPHPSHRHHVAASSVVVVHCWDDRPVGRNFASGVGGRWKVDHRGKVGRQNSVAASYCSVVDLFVASVVVHYCSWIVEQVGHCNPRACRSCPVVALGGVVNVLFLFRVGLLGFVSNLRSQICGRGPASRSWGFDHISIIHSIIHRSVATSIGQYFQFSQQKSIAPPPPRFLSFTMTEILESPFEVILCEGYAGTSQISAQSRIFLNRPTKISDNIPEAMQKANEQTKVTGGKLGEWLATGKDPLHL